ncbi:MAG: adenylyl-sulfate kinase [Candidatus Promineifilaceae bacterium]|nr:adenylyl-sulfate kinase [Candidatus Promineifilaceae bacterium]
MAAGFALWFTGLPSSGKSTLARTVAEGLVEEGTAVQLLDSDEMRRVLTPEPTYSAAERDWFYDVVVYVARLLVENGVNVIIAATGPRRRYREAARARLARFAEVYVDCPPAVCRERDPKGLWAKADQGLIRTLPGAGAPYEPPAAPEVQVDSSELSVEQAATQVLKRLRDQEFFTEA